MSSSSGTPDKVGTNTDSKELFGNVPRMRVPDCCRGVDVVIGVDEAGRGPLLGPLVYCAAFWPESENEAISKLGFDDSKALKEGERERLLAGLLKHPSIGFVIEELTAERISEEMLNPIPTSLNQISYNAVVRMLERIRDCGRGEAQCDAAPLPHECFVDTVGDPGLYESKLRQGLGRSFETKFTIEKKADATYKVVSAASIIAKCTRDAVVSSCRWEEESLNSLTPLDTKFGSGYPGDEACVQWLARAEVNAGLKLFGLPNFARFSWSTARESLKRSGSHQVQWECDEEDGGAANITSFFAQKSDKRPKRDVSYFNRNKMRHVLPGDMWYRNKIVPKAAT